jgi:hypothetical protein
MVFEKRVLRKTFWPQREVVMGRWRKLNNEKLHDTYSPNIIRVMK